MKWSPPRRFFRRRIVETILKPTANQRMVAQVYHRLECGHEVYYAHSARQAARLAFRHCPACLRLHRAGVSVKDLNRGIES